MKNKHISKQSLSEGERRRTRTAIVTSAVLCLGLLLLGIWSAHESGAEKESAMEYLASEAVSPQSDPLLLVELGGFELTGVSSDGAIVGYASDVPVGEAAKRLTDVLQSTGWILTGNSDQGILSFGRQDTEAGMPLGCLVQLSPLGQGCALVVQRW